MDHFKAFIQLQVKIMWEQLDNLLMPAPSELMEGTRPGFSLRNLKDDTTNRERGWNFLHLPTNKEQLGDATRWLLLRVLDSAKLRGESAGPTTIALDRRSGARRQRTRV